MTYIKAFYFIKDSKGLDFVILVYYTFKLLTYKLYK